VCQYHHLVYRYTSKARYTGQPIIVLNVCDVGHQASAAARSPNE
jgi:hypothetical protein